MQLGEAFLKDFVEQCIKDANECLAELKRHAGSRTWGDCRESAHALKGIAENLGAQLMAERCQQIMRASDEALARELSRLMTELSSQMLVVAEQSRREAANLCQRSAENPGKAPGPDPA